MIRFLRKTLLTIQNFLPDYIPVGWGGGWKEEMTLGAGRSGFMYEVRTIHYIVVLLIGIFARGEEEYHSTISAS